MKINFDKLNYKYLMSLHNNLQILIDNINEPELFNLYLESPDDIMLKIIKEDDIISFVKIYKYIKKIYDTKEFNILKQKISKSDFKYIFNVLLSQENIPSKESYNIIKYIIANSKNHRHYIANKIKTNKHKFTLKQLQNIKYNNFYKYYKFSIETKQYFISINDIQNDLSKEHYLNWMFYIYRYFSTLKHKEDSSSESDSDSDFSSDSDYDFISSPNSDSDYNYDYKKENITKITKEQDNYKSIVIISIVTIILGGFVYYVLKNKK